MLGISCFIVFCLFFMLFPCKGLITSPPDGTNYIFLPGSTNRITWIFTDVAKDVTQQWFFKSSNEGSQEKPLATVAFDGSPSKRPGVLPRFNITKPGTLFLINVDERYDGTYRFLISPSESQVRVFIAKKPTVTVCSSPLIINEDEDGSCICRGDNGNPPASVVWFDKNNKQIDEKRNGEKTLTLTNVDGTDSGSYKCVAESYPDEEYRDEKTIQVNVRLNFRPRRVNITFSQRKAEIGDSINITCESIGQPEPSFIITHNESEIIAEKTYNIPQVKWSDNGLYQCIAKNKLGSNSMCYCLTVLGEATSSKKEDCDAGDTVVVWHIVVSLFSGVVIGCLLSYIVSCSRRKFISKKPRQPNPEPPKPDADKIYQELDLTKMNKEENYQSLRGNQSVAGNDSRNEDDSNYTKLSRTKEAEKTYQSLT